MSPNGSFPVVDLSLREWEPFAPASLRRRRRILTIVGETFASRRASATVSFIMRATRIVRSRSFAHGRFPTSSPRLFLGGAMAAHALRDQCGWQRGGALIKTRMIILPSRLVVTALIGFLPVGILIVRSSSTRWRPPYASEKVAC